MDTATIREKITNNLRSMILKGKLRPETKVPERDLATRLGVSITPVKQALLILEAEGFVDVKSRAGTTVISVSPHLIQQSDEALNALCIVFFSSVLKVLDGNQIQKLRQLYDSGSYKTIKENLFKTFNNKPLEKIIISLFTIINYGDNEALSAYLSSKFINYLNNTQK